MVEITTEDIIKYLEGGLSPEEKEIFEKEIRNSEKLRQEAERIAFLWKTSSALRQQAFIDTEKNWQQLLKRIKKDRIKTRILMFSRSAAAILLLPVLILSGILALELRELKDAPVQQFTVTAAAGTISKINLADGTEVWLNSGSSLSYPDRFTSGSRAVHLSGEAYFKVQSDRDNRFDVLVNNELVVSAFGTEFNINGYTDEKSIDVTLVEGNVQVLDKKNNIEKNLLPGEHLAYHKQGGNMAVSMVHMIEKTGWKDGRLAFRRTGMQEVARRLSRHFNVDIQLEGEELPGYAYSATFTTESLDEILRLIKRTAPVQYTIIEPEQGSDYSFSKKKVIINTRK
ncbi:MAG: DUF4974 domain-containing protein [Candidatus Azobacteroides sp.]|nr:DUF4974 domain-containing protein [Candidatus Azobacteroides sp.]